MSIKLIRILITAMLTLAILSVSAFAGDAEKEVSHAYVGAKKCKTCHKANFASWSETKHAKAFDLLSAEEQKDPKCLKCHTTGTTAKGVELEGIQCEACHGAGKDYKSPKIMSKKKWKADPEAHMKMALDAGLIIPTEETCKKCHIKEGNPNYKEFDFAASKDKVHPPIDAKK